MKRFSMPLRLTTLAAASAFALVGLTACGGGGETTPTSTEAASTATAETHSAESNHKHVVELHDPWVKAAKEGGMTAMFGMVHNHTDEAVTIVSAKSDVAKMAELHTVVTESDGSSKMIEQEEGFSIPAGGELNLKPGGEHVMLMGLKQDLVPGDTVKVTLTLSNGETVEVEAPVKEYTGAQETYKPGDEHGEHGEHGGHDHGGHDHGGHDN